MKYEDLYFKVCVMCITYNHAELIKSALNGFVNQKTNFPFLCLIIDDASTDGENDVISKFLSDYCDVDNNPEETDKYRLLFAKCINNPNCYIAYYSLKFNHYSKHIAKRDYVDRWEQKSEYAAYCEGDDFWIHDEKLQKQVDFLDSHSEHTLCFHAHNDYYSEEDIRISKRYDKDMDVVPMKDIVVGSGGFMATSSMLYRVVAKDNYPEWAKNAPIGDFPMMLVLSARGKVGYINEVMSNYRREVSGSWSERISKDKAMYQRWYNGLKIMTEEFDSWSDYKYHDYVKILRRNDRIDNIKYNLHQIKIIDKILGAFHKLKNSFGGER